MMKYVNNTYDPTYKKTLGVNFMEKSIELGTTDIRVSIYDVGGSPEFRNMSALATKDALGIVYVFDLTSEDTLRDIKEWFKLANSSNTSAIPILVGTKYDKLLEMDKEYQEFIHRLALKFAKALKASVVFTSASDSINVQKVVKILISKAFDLQIGIQEIKNVGEPLLLHQPIL